MRLKTLFLLAVAVDAYTVLHLADFHLDVDYSIHGQKQKMCHEDGTTPNETLGTFGDYMCDSPKPLIEHAIDEAHRLFPNPDLILWTGDNVAHVEGYGWQLVFDVINVTTSLLFKRFPGATILPTYGNHDYAPSNGFESDSGLYLKTWELWKNHLGEGNKGTFLKGGYYKYKLPNATAVVLNTNLYYNVNKAYANFTDKHDPAGQFAFLEAELAKAEKCPNRVSSDCTSLVHVIAHIGPGVFERTPNFTWFRDEYNERFLNLTLRYANSIGWMMFGHHHTDTFHIVKDDKGTPVQLIIMSPAITPWFSSLEGAGSNNPSFRVYDTDSYSQIEDIRTYYINLDDLNKNSTAPFVFEYSFRDAYNINEAISAKAMSDVVDKMKTNDTLFQSYIKFNSVLKDPVMPQKEFRGAQLCSLEFSDYPRYRSCLSTYYSASRYSIPIMSLLAVLINELILNE